MANVYLESKPVVDNPEKEKEVQPIGSGAREPSPLQALGLLLRQQTWVKADSVQIIETASVPVIKLLTTNNLRIDITCPSSASLNHSGTTAKDLVIRFMQEFPPLRPLALVMKQFLHQNSLNNPYSGKLLKIQSVKKPH